MAAAPVRVLVVDDSAFARKVVREVLSGGSEIEVIAIARDGLDALEKITELSPDVVTLDLVMPNLDGVGLLRALKDAPKRPAVVVVSMTDEDSDLGVEALSLGAFDVVKKPTALATDGLYDLRDELREKVLAAAVGSPLGLRARRSPVPLPAQSSAPSPTELVVIGASTGGPQAVAMLTRALPSSFRAPIVVVLHMPEGYTEAFARRLDAEAALDVMEARDGLSLRPGLVAVARAGMHLVFERHAGAVMTRLAAAPFHTTHRPSVDVTFASAAACFGAHVLGVVLTGMGSDGLVGSRAITAAGGRVLTEVESSCVVYGMPRSVMEAGLSAGQAPIESMATLIAASL